MLGPCQQTACETAARVRRREISAVEVTQAHLERLTAVNPRLGAFLYSWPERALAQAREVDQAIKAGQDLPLAGIPLAVKDNLNLAGLPTSCASKILEGYCPPYTATAVARLERAGAVVLGKTNLDEFGMGSSTENSAFQVTRNPWDTERVPGGSSGGSAAAVAARMAPLALGTDTGGSIRQPAAMCGVVGLKPTYGRVSRYGVVAYASSLDQVGPLARTVEDVALASAALFGPDPADATSSSLAVPDFPGLLGHPAPEALRVGVPWRELEAGVSAGVLDSFKAALASLQEAGSQIATVDLPHLAHAIATYYIVATAEASSNLSRYDGVRYGRRGGQTPDLARMYGETRDAGFGAEVKRRILLGTFVLSSGYYDAYYSKAQKVRTLVRRDFEEAFAVCDVVALPTAPSVAFRLGEKTADPLQMYLQDVFTVPANLAGIPGLSLPSAPVGGLPCGLQLLGRPFDEASLLRLGHAFQQLTSHHLAEPSL